MAFFGTALPIVETVFGLLDDTEQKQQNLMVQKPQHGADLRQQIIRERLDQSNPLPIIAAGLSALSQQSENSPLRQKYEPVLQDGYQRLMKQNQTLPRTA